MASSGFLAADAFVSTDATIPHAFASFEVPQIVDAFWVMLGLTIHDGVERHQFAIGRKNGST